MPVEVLVSSTTIKKNKNEKRMWGTKWVCFLLHYRTLRSLTQVNLKEYLGHSNKFAGVCKKCTFDKKKTIFDSFKVKSRTGSSQKTKYFLWIFSYIILVNAYLIYLIFKKNIVTSLDLHK